MPLNDEIETRRRAGIYLIKSRRSSPEVKRYLTRVNNGIAEDLHYILSLARDLLQDPAIGDLNWTLEQFIDSLGTPSIKKMKALVMSKLGARNSKIRETAAKIASTTCISRETSLAEIINIQKILYKYRNKNNLDLKALPESEKIINQVLTAAEVAEEIYSFVADFEYVPERREYLQPPIYTFERVKGGDCDDISMLACSLWESIGFETTLNEVPEHVFPGIKILVPYESDNNLKIRMCNIMADPLTNKYNFNMFRFSLDLCSGKKSVDDFKRLFEEWQSFYVCSRVHTIPPIEFPDFINPISVIPKNVIEGFRCEQ